MKTRRWSYGFDLLWLVGAAVAIGGVAMMHVPAAVVLAGLAAVAVGLFGSALWA